MSLFAWPRAGKVVASTVVRTALCVGLVWMSPGMAPAAAQAADERFAAMAQVDAVMAMTENLRSAIDRTHIDVGALGLELAFEEPATIVDYVRNNIAFEQYPGLLRGAEGTLVSGAGNALDQAVLLATLLSDAGFDARIASGRLSSDDAAALISTMASPSRSGAPAIEADEARTATEAFGVGDETFTEVSESVQAEEAALRAEVDEVAAALTAALTGAGLLPSRSDVGAELMGEARDYYWVEYSQGAEWLPVHVLFDEGEEPAVNAEYHIEEAVPEHLQHRFRFQVFVEQRLGDRLEAKPVTAAWERPVANMHGVALSYANVPDGLAGAAQGVEEALLDTTFFIPTINGDLADGAMSFDLEGNTVSPSDAANPAAGVFQTVGGAFGRAAGALAGGTDPDDFVMLTAQWIEYTLIAPDGEETVFRRTVVDRLGQERREQGILEPLEGSTDEAVASALATSYTFLLAPGHYSYAYVLDRHTAATLAAEPLLRSAVESTLDPDAPEPTTAVEYTAAARATDLLTLFSAFDVPVGQGGTVAYRAEPNLVVVERALDGSRELVDVVNNSRRVLADSDSGYTPDVTAALTKGVWETRLEGSILTSGADDRWGAFLELAEPTLTADLTIIAPGDLESARGLGLPGEVAAAVMGDLAGGYAVAVDPVPGRGQKDIAWWRVKPEDGETLGRGGDGRGVEVAEYEAQLALSSFLTKLGLGFGATFAVAGCVRTTGWQLSCCLFENLVVGAVMTGIGAALAGAFAASSIAMFVIWDIGVGSATMAAGLMGQMPTLCSTADAGCEEPTLVDTPAPDQLNWRTTVVLHPRLSMARNLSLDPAATFQRSG